MTLCSSVYDAGRCIFLFTRVYSFLENLRMERESVCGLWRSQPWLDRCDLVETFSSAARLTERNEKYSCPVLAVDVHHQCQSVIFNRKKFGHEQNIT